MSDIVGWFACSKPAKSQYNVCNYAREVPTFENTAANPPGIFNIFQKMRVFFDSRNVEGYLLKSEKFRGEHCQPCVLCE